MTVQLLEGDCLDILPTLAADSIESCVCDPPYHLQSIVKRYGGENAAPAKSNGATGVYARSSAGFMGQTWDGGDIAFRVELWAEVLRVLKPGGYMVAFASTRGYHRMVCAIEDAGFTIHPMLGWIFGSGFPKAHKVDDPEWTGWAYGLQSLKPALEPICLAQKPFSEKNGTANVLRHGTGAINVDGCRVGTVDATERPSGYINYAGGKKKLDGNSGGHAAGRWPANVLHDGSDEVLEAFAASAAITDAQTVLPCYSSAGQESKSWNGTANFAERHSAPDQATLSEGLGGSAAESMDVSPCESLKDGPPPSDISERLTAAGIDNGARKAVDESSSSLSTDGFGKRQTDPSQMDLISIIAAMTEPTTESKTCSFSQQKNTTPTINSSENGREQNRTAASSGAAASALSGSPLIASPLAGPGDIRATASLAQSHTSKSGSTHATDSPARFFKECPLTPDELRFMYHPKASKAERGVGNTHPCVKPLSLMRWLCRLITPPGGTVLDPFLGSGSTAIAASQEGFHCIGIEREAEYMAIARARITADAPLFCEVA